MNSTRLSATACLAAALLPITWAATAPAQTPAPEATDTGRFHWAYAAHFGTGMYSLSDGSDVLIIRVPVQWKLRDPDPTTRCGCGIRLLFPATVGVEELEREAAGQNGFSLRARQISLLPGVELEFPRSERWTLRVRGQLGRGVQRNGASERATIYAAGVRSRYAWPDHPGRPAMINGLLWSGYDPGNGRRRSMSRISNGVEFDLPLSRWTFRGDAMHLRPHFLVDWYLDTVDAPSLVDGGRDELDLEWEMGLGAGRAEPFSILGLRFDRVGVAARYSAHGRGYRLFFGSIF